MAGRSDDTTLGAGHSATLTGGTWAVAEPARPRIGTAYPVALAAEDWKEVLRALERDLSDSESEALLDRVEAAVAGHGPLAAKVLDESSVRRNMPPRTAAPCPNDPLRPGLKPSQISIPELQADAWAWFQRQPFAEVAAEISALKIVEELGELARLFVRRAEGRFAGSAEDWSDMVGDEMADKFLSMLQLASREGIEFETALRRKWERVRGRQYQTVEERRERGDA